MRRACTISRFVEIGLLFIGLWPDSAYSIYSGLMYMTTLVIVQYYQYSYVFTNVDLNNFPILIDALSLTVAYTHLILKLLVLWWNRRIFINILKSMDQDWKECADQESYMSSMINVADLSRRCSNVLIGTNACAAFFMTIGAYLLQLVGENDSNNSEVRKLSIRLELPFNITQSPVFECVLILRFLYELIIASVVGVVNSLLVTLVLHVSGQIDIMQQDLTKISHGKFDRGTSLSVIKGLICRHQNIITLSENIENLFCFIALMQILWNTWVMCFTIFMIISTMDNDKDVTILVKTACFFIAITLEVFIFCFAGEFLTVKCKSIGNTIYNTLWYDMPPTDSRILLFVILRSQKRLVITAGKVVELTLESFTSLIKASVSYTAVLNTMH